VTRVQTRWEPRGVWRIFWGHITGQDAIESFARIADDERFDTIRYNLLDFTEVESWRTDDEKLRPVGAHTVGPALSNPNIRVLIVTGDDDLKEVARRYVAQGLNRYHDEVFSAVDEARRWIESKLFPLSAQDQA